MIDSRFYNSSIDFFFSPFEYPCSVYRPYNYAKRIDLQDHMILSEGRSHHDSPWSRAQQKRREEHTNVYNVRLVRLFCLAVYP